MSDPRRPFSARTATFLVVSSTVGGGVLGIAGDVELGVGGPAPALAMWMVGGLIAACGAMALAEVSAALPRSGGEFVILTEAYGPFVGFLGGWVSLVFGFVAPIAATASLGSSYALAAFGRADLAEVRAAATVAIAGLAAAHASGRSRGERVQGLATAGTIVLIAAFAAAGIVAGRANFPSLVDRAPIGRSPAAGFFVGLILVSYAYTGWNAASYIAGELDDPQRRLPRSIAAGTAIVVALYLGLNLVFALGVPIGDLHALADRDPKAVERIAELAATNLFGPRGAAAVSTLSALVLYASLSALILTGPRVAQAMARAGRLPGAIARSSASGDAPTAATAIVASAAILLLWTGRFVEILFAAGVGLALNSLLTVSAVYVLRRSRPDLPRPFRVPGYPLTPAIYLAMTAASLAFAFADRQQRPAALAGLGGIAAGVPCYWATRWGRDRPADDADGRG